MTKSILTEEEKWYFDLHGFLILKDVITAKNLKQMLNIIQNWLEIICYTMQAHGRKIIHV